jgi:hypothetical protein
MDRTSLREAARRLLPIMSMVAAVIPGKADNAFVSAISAVVNDDQAWNDLCDLFSVKGVYPHNL